METKKKRETRVLREFVLWWWRAQGRNQGRGKTGGKKKRGKEKKNQ